MAPSPDLLTTPAIPNGTYWERRGRVMGPVLLAALGLGALGTVQLLPLRHSAEADLTSRSRHALDAAGLPGVRVSFTGQDGTLTGSAPDAADAQRALGIVRGVPGVRTATARITVGVVGGGPGTVATIVPTAAPSTVPGSVPSVTPSAGPSAVPTPLPPAFSPVTAVDVRRRLDALGPVPFATTGSRLGPVAASVVRRAAAVLTGAPGVRVTVIGYTDDVGDWDRNMVLARARAQAVADALVAAGVDRSRITVVGMSEDYPRVPNTSEPNRATNRRVQFGVR